ncbi:MAG: hypothetical protein LUG18_11870 [Candidatus Azobacteroides sp.]|nr:hypothetical protein [Candidatus Azobacteroides sp.]
MKNFILLLLLCSLFTANVFSQSSSGYGPFAISIAADGTEYLYRLDDTSATSALYSDFVGNDPIDGVDFGKVNSLVLTHGIAVSWVNTPNFFNEESLAILFRYFPAEENEPEEEEGWETISLPNRTNRGGSSNNNYRYENEDININIIPLLNNKHGNYKLQFKRSLTHFYDNGNSSYSRPDPNSVTTATFMFDYSTSLVTNKENNIRITSRKETIRVQSAENTDISLYTVTGKLLEEKQGEDVSFTNLSVGIYLVKTDKKVYKAIVK